MTVDEFLLMWKHFMHFYDSLYCKAHWAYIRIMRYISTYLLLLFIIYENWLHDNKEYYGQVNNINFSCAP